MSGVNLDVLSDEQWDEWIAGCRTLRAQRDRYVGADQLTPLATPKAVRKSSKKKQHERSHLVSISPVKKII
jgi:hypothetical protein